MIRALILSGTMAATVWVSLTLSLTGFEIALGNRKAAHFLLTSLGAHPRVLASLASQVAVILWLYAIWFAALWEIARRAERPQHWSGSREAALFTVWVTSAWVLLRMHSAVFPNSLWTWAMEPLFDQAASRAVDALALILLLGILLRAIASVSPRRRIKLRASPSARGSSTSGLIVWGALAAVIPLTSAANLFSRIPSTAEIYRSPSLTDETSKLGNVIIVGLDSLRREVVLNPRVWDMPNLASLVETGFLNQNVITPLARTFPAWVTILTGKHPRASGARTNHSPQKGIDHASSVAWTFHNHGYRTIYATDETRFSHIVPAFGFSEIVGPQMGVTDFLLGQFADQPLVNFAIQIPFAEYLLPALVGNRAFAHAYEPKRFVDRLSRAVGAADQRPVFLAVHLCTAHWPFYVADRKPSGVDVADGPLDLASYKQMLRALDGQLGLLLSQLQELGYLNPDTLLALLADHGEGLASDLIDRPVIVSHSNDDRLSYPLGGHGASLLAPEQWRVFTLFHGRSLGGEISAGHSAALASLEDFGPKLVQLALSDERANDHVEGNGGPSLPPRSHVMMETGWRPSGFNALNPQGSRALRIAESSYSFLPDGRIEMKPAVYEAAIKNKDLGVTDGDRTLVVLESNGSHLVVESDHIKHRWNVYDAAVPMSRDPAFAALHGAACADPEMSVRMGNWCPVESTVPTPDLTGID